MASPIAHLLLIPFPGWGHYRPLHALAARLVSERVDVTVTILITSFDFEKSRFEIESHFEAGSTALQRIRLISISHTPQADLMTTIGELEKSYPAAYETLVQSKPITCATTGTSFEATPAPVSVIIDFLAFSILKATRSLTERSVPVIAWATGSGANLIHLWAPESMGGLGNFGVKVDAEVARTGKSPLEVGVKLFRATSGSIVKIPGVPAMYDHEFFPQTLPFNIPFSILIRNCHEFLMDSDALLMATSDAIERETLNALREWFSGLNKPVYVVGPLVPTASASPELGGDQRDDIKVSIFLDKMLEQHGMHSLVFISFGSQLWPHDPGHLQEVIEALLEKDIPFVLSHASSYGQIPTELLQKIHSSDIGLLISWSPQQFILNHSATGWFLTHGGHGGITESLASGTPMICWPFMGDQPITAAHVTENLRVAFELFEVRTGDNGLKPLHRNALTPKGTREAVGIEIRHILEACFSKEGEEMRRRANQLEKEFRASWDVDGSSRLAMKDFLEKYT